MKRFENKIILSDLDGTLLNSESKVSSNNKEAIKYFVKEGGRFGIASGRGIKNALRFLNDVEINFYSIFANGSILYDFKEKKIAALNTLKKESVLPLLHKCLEEQPSIGIQIYTDTNGYFISEENYTDTKVVEDHIPYEFSKLDQLLEFEWTKVLFNGSSQQKIWLEENSLLLRTQGIIDGVHSSDIYYELLPIESNKGSMVRRIKNGLSKDEMIYVIGDYYNDIEMMQEAHVGIFTENAPEEIKPYADYISSSCNNDAVANVIEHIIT